MHAFPFHSERLKMRALLCLKPCLYQVLAARACFPSRIARASVSVSPTAHPRSLVWSLVVQGCLKSSAVEAYQPLILRSQRARDTAKSLHGTRSIKTAESFSHRMRDLCDQDKSLINMFLAASSHQWQLLPGKLSALAVVSHNSLSPSTTVVMTGLQSLQELAMSTIAVLLKCEAASDMWLCKFWYCLYLMQQT